MKNYRVKVRDDKAGFFEELMRYLDFLDYETVEGFSEPRIYPSFELRGDQKRGRNSTKNSGKTKGKNEPGSVNNLNTIREVMQKIEAMRDKGKKR